MPSLLNGTTMTEIEIDRDRDLYMMQHLALDREYTRYSRCILHYSETKLLRGV